MSLENMISQFEKRAATAAPIGGSIKFEVDGQGILIDGTGDTNTVSASNGEADCTISLTAEVLEKLKRRRPQSNDGRNGRSNKNNW